MNDTLWQADGQSEMDPIDWMSHGRVSRLARSSHFESRWRRDRPLFSPRRLFAGAMLLTHASTELSDRGATAIQGGIRPGRLQSLMGTVVQRNTPEDGARVVARFRRSQRGECAGEASAPSQVTGRCKDGPGR